MVPITSAFIDKDEEGVQKENVKEGVEQNNEDSVRSVKVKFENNAYDDDDMEEDMSS